MSEWKETTLGHEVNLITGFPFKSSQYTDDMNGIRLLRGDNIVQGKLRWEGVKRWSLDGSTINPVYQLCEGDVVLAMDRPWIEAGLKFSVISRFDLPCLLVQRVACIRGGEKLSSVFLRYLIASKEFTKHILAVETGTAVPHVSASQIKEFSFQCPPLIEQQAIAAVLSSLDNKIGLLHRQNKTLEAMAETLFRHWFVVEAREDWEDKPLSFFGDIVCGKTPPKSNASYFEGTVPFIKIPDMHGQTFIFSTTDTLTELGRDFQRNKTLPARSVCVSCIATVGLVSMNIIESQTNQQINAIVPHKDFYRYFLYLFMKSSTDLLLALASGGTATLNLNTGDFSKILIPYCGEDLLSHFNSRVKSIFEKIFINQNQICTLATLRDNLLPKLMSGEVRVT